MLEYMARKRRLASLAIVAGLMVVVAGCSSGGPGARTAVQPTIGSTPLFVTDTSPSKARLNLAAGPDWHPPRWRWAAEVTSPTVAKPRTSPEASPRSAHLDTQGGLVWFQP